MKEPKWRTISERSRLLYCYSESILCRKVTQRQALHVRIKDEIQGSVGRASGALTSPAIYSLVCSLNPIILSLDQFFSPLYPF